MLSAAGADTEDGAGGVAGVSAAARAIWPALPGADAHPSGREANKITIAKDTSATAPATKVVFLIFIFQV